MFRGPAAVRGTGKLWLRVAVGATILIALILASSQFVLAQQGSPPARPARPSISSVTHNAVAITWSAPSDSSITGYQILRRNPTIHASGVFEVIQDDTGSSSTSYEDTSVAAETRYVYRVKARNAHGLSERSRGRPVTTTAVPTPSNTAPTGLPTISGTAQVGETLSADTSGISDANGLTNPQFAYQWIRTSGGTDADISGATGSTYTLSSDDQGYTVKVRVSFTDDDGYSETLTSAATDFVATLVQVVSPPVDPPTYLHSSHLNSEATGLPSISGTAHVGETLTAGTSRIRDANGLTSVSYSYRWMQYNDSSQYYEYISGATSSTFDLTASHVGTSFRVNVRFTDDNGYSESRTSNPTFDVVAPADAQTGGTFVSEARNSDFAAGTATTGQVSVGGEPRLRNILSTVRGVTGRISPQGDKDWYKITLEGGKNYRIAVLGRDNGHNRTLSNTRIFGVYNSSGSKISGTSNNNSVRYEARVYFMPGSDADYFISVGGGGSTPDTGSYQLIVQEVPVDVSDNTSTTGTITADSTPVSGEIDKRDDVDWYKLSTTANKGYIIDMTGGVPSNGDHDDVLIVGVYDAAGDFIPGTRDDNSGDTLSSYDDARSSFVAATTGPYYIAVKGSVPSGTDTGSYKLWVTEVPASSLGD